MILCSLSDMVKFSKWWYDIDPLVISTLYNNLPKGQEDRSVNLWVNKQIYKYKKHCFRVGALVDSTRSIYFPHWDLTQPKFPFLFLHCLYMQGLSTFLCKGKSRWFYSPSFVPFCSSYSLQFAYCMDFINTSFCWYYCKSSFLLLPGPASLLHFVKIVCPNSLNLGSRRAYIERFWWCIS